MNYIDSGAIFSADGRYRYLLWREWRGTHDPKNWEWLGVKDGNGAEVGEPKACVFVMLNPSTADGNVDDPTIRRCVAFAKEWKFERLEVINLFAHRATDPKQLLSLSSDDDPVGPDNLNWVHRVAAKAGLIVCAWGKNGRHVGQDETMRGWLGGEPCYALGLTATGEPRHPLYIKSGTRLVPLS